ncbi:MFS transporter [Lentibacillus populi]|uniref:MFS transporter n=1 Tax=Lentibacillus populi TaxID=1827502 RepID=A0A9W5TZ01_9BACI|nr:MFS transporter [Lentibacillus populi]GGB48220.1 MFS transporter [Lentibacillus populi]
MNKRKTRTLIVLLTSTFMFSIAGSRPLIPLYADNLGASNILIGLIVALFSFLPLFVSVKIGKIVDEIGSKRFLKLGLLMGGISLIIPFFINNLYGVFISQISAGLAQIVFVVAMQSFTGGFSEKDLREYFINIFSISVALGSFLGPLFGGFISDFYGYPIALMSGGVLLIMIIPLVKRIDDHYVYSGKESIKENNYSIFHLFKFKSLQYAFLMSALILVAKDTYTAFFPLLAREYGISNFIIGFIISLNAAAGILIRLLLPFMLSYLQRRMIINISILLSGIVLLLHPLFSSQLILIGLSFVLGIGLGIGQPLSIASTVEYLPSNQIGEGLGLRLTINRLTQVLTPVSVGGVSALFGIGSVFYFTGFIVLGGIIGFLKPNNL